MIPALVIGHPTTLVASVILVPVILAIAVFLPGNQFLPLASLAANQVYAATGDNAAQITNGFSGGALDFASSLFGWVLYCGVKLSYVGMGVLAVITLAMMVINRQRIVKEEKK